jgi:hypothetical protein
MEREPLEESIKFKLYVAETYRALDENNQLRDYRYNIMKVDTNEWNVIITCFQAWFNEVYVMDWSDDQESLDNLLSEYGLPNGLIKTCYTGECELMKRHLIDVEMFQKIYKATLDSSLDRTWYMELYILPVI